MKLDPNHSTGKLCTKHPRYGADNCPHCKLNLAYESAVRDDQFMRESRELNPGRTYLSEGFLEALENWAEARDEYRAKLKACTGPSPAYYAHRERTLLDEATRRLDDELRLLVSRIVTVIFKNQPSPNS